MLMADTVMDADEPRFQIGEDEMDDRQIVLGNLWVAALGNGKVFIPALAEAGISTPIVSDGQRPRSNGALHEPTKRVGAPIGYYGEPDTPGIASVLSLVLRGSRFPMTNLDGTSDENLVVDTPAFAASPSTNPCLVYLNMFPRLAADTILIGPHHASAELVENAEGRLIARQAKLSLKLNRRDAGRLAGDQISRPKPCAQRHMAAFHDGANRQARIVAALATAQDTGTSGDAEGIACGMAMRTDEAVAPSSFFHVGSTLRFIGKKLLKLWKRPRKGQVVTLKDVHGSLSIIHTKSIPSGCVRQADRQGEFNRFVSRLETKLADKRLHFLIQPTKTDGKPFKTDDFEDIMKQFIGYLNRANVTIVDLSGIPFEVLSITVSLVSRLIFDFCFHYSKLRQEQDVLNDVPVMIICEEAHNYIQQRDDAAYRSSRKSLERIAKEGRKYGLNLMVVSQRPSEVSETIFAQCNNFLALRLTNNADQNYVKRLFPDNSSGITDILPNLAPGECVVVGDAVLLPAVVQMPLPKPEPHSQSVCVHKEWKEPWRDFTFADVISRWRKE